MSKKNVIIVAGGSGKRMQAEMPKQFLNIKGKPVLYHTMQCFYSFDNNINIVLVLPENQIEYWNKVCVDLNITIPHTIAVGGHERFFSVKNGLACIDNDNLVAVHDGVRPLVSHLTIRNCYDQANRSGAAIPVTDVIETIRFIENNKSRTVDRSVYKMVQTPQIFSRKILDESYQQDFSISFTDDASVVESAGYEVRLVEGNTENIKITRPVDLEIAGLFLK